MKPTTLKLAPEYRGNLAHKPKLVGPPTGTFRSLAGIYLPRPVKMPARIAALMPEHSPAAKTQVLYPGN